VTAPPFAPGAVAVVLAVGVAGVLIPGLQPQRALRATPRLAHVRVESHRYVTDRLVDAYSARLPPGFDREALWQRLRLSVELGFAADEMVHEETRIPRDTVFRMMAKLLRGDAWY